MKTKFEELYSKILYTDEYEKDKVIFWFLNKDELKDIFLDDIMEVQEGMFLINKAKYYTDKVFEPVLIPFYRIYLVTYRDQILLDRRSSYKGKVELELPDLDMFANL